MKNINISISTNVDTHLMKKPPKKTRLRLYLLALRYASWLML